MMSGVGTIWVLLTLRASTRLGGAVGDLKNDRVSLYNGSEFRTTLYMPPSPPLHRTHSVASVPYSNENVHVPMKKEPTPLEPPRKRRRLRQPPDDEEQKRDAEIAASIRIGTDVF